jgi:hypothetical protein
MAGGFLIHRMSSLIWQYSQIFNLSYVPFIKAIHFGWKGKYREVINAFMGIKSP